MGLLAWRVSLVIHPLIRRLVGGSEMAVGAIPQISKKPSITRPEGFEIFKTHIQHGLNKYDMIPFSGIHVVPTICTYIYIYIYIPIENLKRSNIITGFDLDFICCHSLCCFSGLAILKIHISHRY